ncbi:hypothetical protein [Fretibacterium fastidiosum]|uniref:hypothetical protein n=1 Tax=Fretibacterium fastidiosum TaxID=651822 RepID=UPI001AD7E9D3|nr:hypothetical protein [Fretibacterium fastidiosum]
MRQFKAASVLFVLALAAITFEGKPASAAPPGLKTEFFIEYAASTLESGDVSVEGETDLTVKGFSEMFLGAKVDVVGTRQEGVFPLKVPNEIQKDSSAGLDYRVGVPNHEGSFGFSAGTKPGDTGKLVLKMQNGGTSSKFTFDITAKDPVSVDQSKAALAIDTSTASEDTLTLTLKPMVGAVLKDLKVAGVAFDFDPAKLDAAKLSLTWDGAANKIQAKALNAAYSVKDVPVKAKVDVTFTGVDGQNWTLSEAVNFTITSRPGRPATVTVTATAGAGGTIAPKGAVTVAFGADQAFTISPDRNYKIKDVKVNGASVGAVATHTMKNVTSDGTIEATFEKTSGGGGGGGSGGGGGGSGGGGGGSGGGGGGSGGGGGGSGGGGCNAGYAFLPLLGLLPLASRMKKR